MTTVDENRLKSNSAVNLVSSRLSPGCLVRPVAADTDVGIDLFCETVQEGRPFLHFWLQVKSGTQCHVVPDASSASCSFDTPHLEYWERQPVPVFAALVPVSLSSVQEPAIYIVDITTHLLEKKLNRDVKSQTLTSQYTLHPGNRDEVNFFLTEVVPVTVALLRCREGIVSLIPTPEPQYFKRIPRIPVELFGDEILTQIRRTAAISLLSLRLRNTHEGPMADLRRRLARVAAQFDGDTHWETFAGQAYSCHVDHAYTKAVGLYDRALEIIEADNNTHDDLEWITRAHVLRQNRAKALNEEGL